MSAVLKRSPVAADPICAAAIDLAWTAAIEEGGPEAVGGHLGCRPEAEHLVVQGFSCTLPGYVGWEWNVTLSRAARSRRVTVSEVHLLPTPEALQAPEWVPWSERIRPGDLAAGNTVQTDPDDARLAPGWSGADELEGGLEPGPLHPVNWEAGLGRSRVPSRTGRSEAANRWYLSERGPHGPQTRAAPGECGGCGWMLNIGGPLGQVFGVCTNMLSPSDGSIVSFDHGCGGYSEAPTSSTGSSSSVVLDDHRVDDLDMGHS